MMEFPSFEEVPESPRAPEPAGVAAALGGSSFGPDEPVALHLSFQAGGRFLVQCNQDPLAWVLIIVVGRDLPGAWVKPAAPLPLPSVVRVDDRPAPPPDVRFGGHASVDLRGHLDLPKGPGRYWVMASMGEYMTDRMAFELR